jgi:hypothetical protein
MFVGFTPGDFSAAAPFVNPRHTRIFKMIATGIRDKGREFATLTGANIIEGFRRLGYLTVGTGSVRWFNPDLPAGRVLTQDFERYFFAGDYRLKEQVEFVQGALAGASGPVFAFINVGETHVPYYHRDAPWSEARNPCVPYTDTNDADECRVRQTGCLEYADRELAPLLAHFAGANTIVCADHGDAWGEGGFWEHSIHHEKVYEVPLLFRLPNPPHHGAREQLDRARSMVLRYTPEGVIERIWRVYHDLLGR